MQNKYYEEGKSCHIISSNPPFRSTTRRPKTKPITIAPSSIACDPLFEDDCEEDDILFGSTRSTTKRPTTKPTTASTSTASSSIACDPLFEDDCEEDDILFGSSTDYLDPVYDYDEYENTSDYEDSKDYENIFPEYGENPNDSVEPSDFEDINPKDTSRFQQVFI